MKKNIQLLVSALILFTCKISAAGPEEFHQAVEKAKKELPSRKEKCEALRKSYVSLIKGKEGPLSVLDGKKGIEEALKLVTSSRNESVNIPTRDLFLELKEPTKEDVYGYWESTNGSCAVQNLNIWRSIVNTASTIKANAKLNTQIVDQFEKWSNVKHETLLEVMINFTITKSFYEKSLLSESKDKKNEIEQIAKESKTLQTSIQADMKKEMVGPDSNFDAQDEKAIKEWKEATKFEPRKIQAISKTESIETQKLDARVKSLLESK